MHPTKIIPRATWSDHDGSIRTASSVGGAAARGVEAEAGSKAGSAVHDERDLDGCI